MKSSLCVAIVVVCLVAGVAPACAWSDARPALVVQLSHSARGRDVAGALETARKLTLLAAVSMALERESVRSTAPPLEPRESGSVAALEPGSDAFDAAGCGTAAAALCLWARSQEERAFVAAVSHVELPP